MLVKARVPIPHSHRGVGVADDDAVGADVTIPAQRGRRCCCRRGSEAQHFADARGAGIWGTAQATRERCRMWRQPQPFR